MDETFPGMRKALEKAGWEAEGVNLAGYNVIEAAADVRAVAQALGYEKIILWGGSFGSHWSMAVMRYEPDIVARAVLTGLEGPDHTYDSPSGVLAAIRSIAEEAESTNDGRLGTKSRKLLRESILQSTELFAAKPYFLSDEFSLVDATIAPVLWRLPMYGIELGSAAEPIEAYMQRVFARQSFQNSLTELEQEMRL